MKLLNRSIFLLLFIFYSTISVMAEPLKFTQYYAIETNATDDEELIKVIKQIDGYLNNNAKEQYKYDEIKKECFPLAVSEFKEDIIQKIVSYSNLFCVVDYEHTKWLKEQELKKKSKQK